MNADNNSTIAAAKATIARVAVTTTSIISTVISETTAPAPTAAPSNIPNTASATVSQDPPPVGGSKYYSAICIVCGVGFVSAVLFYIYATRNKSYNTNDNTIMKRTMNQSGGNSGKFDIRVDKPSKSPSGKGSTFNMSGDNSFAYSSFQQSENLSPYSEQNTFVNNSNPMAMGYNGNQDQKKLHYPNPLYEHSRPINRNTSVIRATESDITDEDVNLNILTQEEIQLLKMRQKNMRNGNNINNINNYNNDYNNYNNMNMAGSSSSSSDTKNKNVFINDYGLSVDDVDDIKLKKKILQEKELSEKYNLLNNNNPDDQDDKDNNLPPYSTIQ